MSVTIRKQDGEVVAGIPAEFSSESRKELKQKLLAELERGERRFLIDLRETGYVDSAALGILVSLSKKIRDGHGALRLAHLNDDLRTLFAVTRLDTLFQIDDDGADHAGQTQP